MFRRSSILIVLATVALIYINCNYLQLNQKDKVDKIRARLSISGFKVKNNQKEEELSKLSEDLDNKLRFDSSLDEQIARKAEQLQDQKSVRIQKLAEINEQKAFEQKKIEFRADEKEAQKSEIQAEKLAKKLAENQANPQTKNKAKNQAFNDYSNKIERVRKESSDVLKNRADLLNIREQNMDLKTPVEADVEPNEKSSCSGKCVLEKRLLIFSRKSIKSKTPLNSCEKFADLQAIMDRQYEVKKLLNDWDLVYYLMSGADSYIDRPSGIGRFSGRGRGYNMEDNLLFSNDNPDFIEGDLLKVWAFILVC